MPKLTRRDFLKLTALAGSVAVLSTLAPKNTFASTSQKGVIIFVFDAMSAPNLSVYGYPRPTTPNLERFAARATVYHSHNSAGNYTTPGTASLLTGLYPWTHRAINVTGLIARGQTKHNIFNAFGNTFHRFAYSQNIYTTYLLDQFGAEVDELIDPEAFSIINQVIGSKFSNDRGMAYRVFDDFLTQNTEIPASLVLGLISRLVLRRQLAVYKNKDYPIGPPNTSSYPLYFELKEVYDGVIATLKQPVTRPRLSYYHLWAPHAPYRPTPKYLNTFIDNWKPVVKPQHPFGAQKSNADLRTRRSHYDEYIANVDDEFGRVIDFMEADGLFENNYIVVTSDHGEMFERGSDGHFTPLLFDPVIHCPLMISSPGQTARVDVTSPTNSVDVLPTLLHLTGQTVPDWCEGQLLPGLGGAPDSERATFSIEAKTNPAFAPLQKVSIALRKDNYKLTVYKGYRDEDLYELYDLAADPEELTDLFPAGPAIAKTLQAELLDRLQTANAPYQRK